MGKTEEDGAARGQRRAHQGRGMTGDERSSSVLSQAATEMNSHHLDCTITGGRGRWREGGWGRGAEGFPGFLCSQKFWKWDSVLSLSVS